MKLCKVASEQLSKQRHYDFGMRAIKAVVATAGDLARGDRKQQEDVIIVRALRDTNLPKLVAEDVELFPGIIRVCFHSLCGFRWYGAALPC